MLKYAVEAYENQQIYSTFPLVFNTSNTGTGQSSFAATNASFLLSAGARPIIPLWVEIQLTAIPGSTSNWAYAVAIDTTQRYAGQSGAANQLMVHPVPGPGTVIPTAATTALTNGALTAAASWYQSGDFALAANAATYTHATGGGWIAQEYVDMAATKTSVFVPNSSCLLTYTTSATAGSGLLTFTVGGTLFRENQTVSGFSGGAVANGTYNVRLRTGPNPPANGSTFKIEGTSNAAAVTTWDTLSITRDAGANSQALAYYGNITCAAASANVTYIASGLVKGAALATNDRIVLDFGRGLRPPTAATPFVVPVGPCQIPMDGCMVIHTWSTGASGGSPTTLAHARWIE